MKNTQSKREDKKEIKNMKHKTSRKMLDFNTDML